MTAEHSVEVTAKLLAAEHSSDDPTICEIFWAPHPTEVRLVEITNSISDKGEVLPFRFSADPPDVPHETVVVMLSPDDWKRRDDLDWPDGFENLERVFNRGN